MKENKKENKHIDTSLAAIWALVWPQMLMMYVMTLTGFIAVWVAGQLGSDVQGVMGMLAQCSLFLIVIATAIAAGGLASVSQSLGAGKELRARYYLFTTIIVCAIPGIFAAILGIWLTDYVLAFVRLPLEVRPLAADLWYITMLGLPFQYLYASSGVMFRATRQVIQPLIVACIVCLVSLFLSLGLGLGYFGLPNLGAEGLAYSQVLCQLVGAILNFIILRQAGWLKIEFAPKKRWLKKSLPYLLKVAFPAGISQIVWQSGYLTLFILVSSMPKDSIHALAGLTAGLRIESLLFMPAMAFNMSASVLVANCLGANDQKRAKEVALELMFSATLIMSIIALALWPFRQSLAAFLSPNPETQVQIVSYLGYNLVSTPFSVVSTVMGGILAGAGATHYNLCVFGGSFWIIRIPLGWLLGHKIWLSASGVFCAMLISQIIQACVMLYVIYKCNWMKYSLYAHKQNNHK